MNCRGCGVELDPSQEQVNTTVEEILETSLKDAERKEECVRFVAIPRRCLTRIARASYLACCWRACSLVSSWGSALKDRDGPTAQHSQERPFEGLMLAAGFASG